MAHIVFTRQNSFSQMICPSRRKRLVPTKCFGNSPVRKAGPKLQNVILNAPDINNYDVPSHGQNIHCPAQTRFGKALSLLQSHRGLRFQVLRRHLQQMGGNSAPGLTTIEPSPL